MKKTIIALTLAITAIILTGCTGPKTYDEITYSELNQMIKEKKDFVLFIGSETCSACNAYKVTINKIVDEYNVDIKYIDIAKLSEQEQSKLVANFAFNATPTTIFVKKGQEESTHNRIVGNEKYSKTVEKLKENGYIKTSSNMSRG